MSEILKEAAARIIADEFMGCKPEGKQKFAVLTYALSRADGSLSLAAFSEETTIPQDKLAQLLTSSNSWFVCTPTGKIGRSSLGENEHTRNKAMELSSTKPKPSLDYALLKSKSFQQIGNRSVFSPYIFAQTLASFERYVTLRDTGDIYFFNPGSGLWEPGATKIRERLGTTLQEATTRHYILESEEMIRVQTYIDRVTFDEQPLNLIPLKNGIYNLDTKQLEPYQPKNYFTSKLPVDYETSAKCPKINEFLQAILNPEDIPTIFEIAGYCLYRSYPIQKAIMLTGGGQNGKSTLLNLISAFLGVENVSAQTLQNLEENQFATSTLYRKLANISADLPNTALKFAGTFKALTGGDGLTGEHKFKPPFRFVNHAKLLFSCNAVPYVNDDSDGFFRRWHIIPFPHSFDGASADKRLIDKLKTPDELSGFLNEALLGLARLLLEGDFTNSKTTSELREQYKRASEPVAAFVMDCIQQDTEGQETKDAVYGAFCEYCRERKISVLNKETFAKNIRRYVQIEEAQVRIDHERVRVWRTIRLINTGGTSGTSIFSFKQQKINTEIKEEKRLCHPCQTTGNTTETPKIPSNPSSDLGWNPTEESIHREIAKPDTEGNIEFWQEKIRLFLEKQPNKEATEDAILLELKAQGLTLPAEKVQALISHLKGRGFLYERRAGVLALA